jgi:hypothetical protein
MQYLSCGEFLEKLRENPNWRLEMGETGLTLLATDQYGTVMLYHSPDPAQISYFDWVRFSIEIGLIISQRGMA